MGGNRKEGRRKIWFEEKADESEREGQSTVGEQRQKDEWIRWKGRRSERKGKERTMWERDEGKTWRDT